MEPKRVNRIDLKISPENAVKFDSFSFISLRKQIYDSEKEKIISDWSKGNMLFESILQSSFETFWSTILHSNFFDIIDSYLESYPRYDFIQSYKVCLINYYIKQEGGRGGGGSRWL